MNKLIRTLFLITLLLQPLFIKPEFLVDSEEASEARKKWNREREFEVTGGKVAFSLVRASKSMEYPDGNIAVAWMRLKKKYAPTTAPTLAKYHKMFYGAKLRQGSDPDGFITYLEDLQLKMEEMGSRMSDTQFPASWHE